MAKYIYLVRNYWINYGRYQVVRNSNFWVATL